MSKNRLNQGFTLIELLVVITIIAILASIAVPVYNSVTERAKLTKVISNVKQINLACRTFAIDNLGIFPTGSIADAGAGDDSGGGEALTSTECFNELIPDYINQESIFFTAGQAPGAQKRIPDENNDLETQENCFAYVVGLTDSSPGTIPLVADWFTAGGTSYDELHPWWNSGKAVVGRCDGSAAAERITKERGGYILAADKESDLFGVPSDASSGEGTSNAGGLVPETLTIVNP